jgi:hypothetical protein
LLSALPLIFLVRETSVLGRQLAMPSEIYLTGQALYYAHLVALCVALLVRPDVQRTPREVRAAALEWVMAGVGAAFLLFYFDALPEQHGGHALSLARLIQEWVPGLIALGFALGVVGRPYRQVYGVLAVGLIGGQIIGVVVGWRYAEGPYPLWNPLDVNWMLPYLGLAAAAAPGARGAIWVRAAESSAGDRGRSDLALAALALPPVVDLVTRALGLDPELALARSQLTLLTSATLTLLLALRLDAQEQAPARAEPADTAEAREAAGEPSEPLQLASGAAHELNNPLMAVAGWAELAQHRAGADAEPINELLLSTRRAADAVSRLQKLVRSSGDAS